MNKLLLVLCLISLYSTYSYGQIKFDLVADVQTDVISYDDILLQNPWSGGLNSCQFGEIDLNLDGILDLVVFDRNGNRIIPFIYIDNNYLYSPEYSYQFPDLVHWVIVRDYNNDGKADLFTYAKGWAAMIVYKNISIENLEFELVADPFLTSLQGNIHTNILVTYADYPGIADIDNDGDLDILTFWGLGSFVEMHKNMSMEKYGHPDSLDYEKTEFCWGEFAESEESNEIILDTCLLEPINYNGPARHTGSTLSLIDWDSDNDQDLILGDVDFPDLLLLENGGDESYAKIISQTKLFPYEDDPITQFSMPLANMLDIDHDGNKDLVISPFDPGIETSENFKSSIYYRNTDNPIENYEYVTDQFLINEMLDFGSGAYPVLFDYNNDGLLDLFVGNYGYYSKSWYDEYLILHSEYVSSIAYFQNVGSVDHPEFELIDRDFLNLSELKKVGFYPTFGDVDDDGDNDLLIGNSDGQLIFIENLSSVSNSSFAEPILSFQDINVGEYSTPQLINIDGDNKPELIIGEKNGNINYYSLNENNLFGLVTDSLGKINVTDYNLSYAGYSCPRLFMNGDNLDLLVGSEQGRLFYYQDIDTKLDNAFSVSDSMFLFDDNNSILDFKIGMRNAVAVDDLNNDGLIDMIVGNYSGGLNLFNGNDKDIIDNSITENLLPQLIISPNPATNSLNINFPLSFDEKAEVYIYNIQGLLLEYKIISKLESINILSFDSGIYFVKLISVKNKNMAKGRFIKI